jgi:hypothetical protein
VRLEEIQPLDEIQEQQRNDAGDKDGVAHELRSLIVMARGPSIQKQKAVVDRLPLLEGVGNGR